MQFRLTFESFQLKGNLLAYGRDAVGVLEESVLVVY